MTLLLKQLYQFFQLLNSDTATNQLATGLAFGVILGFAPILSIQALLVIFCCFFFRVQLGAATLSAFFFKLVAFLFDPLTDALGRKFLEAPSLRPTFVYLYNIPFFPLTRFNNSIVMGSALVSFIFVIPLFFMFKALIIRYRETVVARYKSSKIWKAWSSTALYQSISGWYEKYHKLYG